MSCKLNSDLKILIILVLLAVTTFIALIAVALGIIYFIYFILSTFEMMEFCSSMLTENPNLTINTLDNLYYSTAKALFGLLLFWCSSIAIILLFIYSVVQSYKQQKQHLEWKKKKSKWHNVLLSYIVVCD